MPEILSIGELLDLGTAANMSAYIPYSGLEYNASGAISGISGSAIAGGIESSVVSSIVSSMVSGKADQSAVDSRCSAMSAEVSAKLDATASSLFQPSGNYMPSGEYYSATNPSGFITTAALTDFAKESALSSKLDASASSNFAPSGDYVYQSAYSSFTGNITNNITSISSVVSGKQDALTFGYSGSYISSINGSAIYDTNGGGGGSFTGVVTDSSMTGNGLAGSALGVNKYDLALDTSITSSIAGNTVTLGVSTAASVNPSSLSSYVPYSSLKNGPSTATFSAIDSVAVYDLVARLGVNNLTTSRIPYSALETNAGVITAISGSAIGGAGGGLPTASLIVDSANMTAASTVNGIQIGTKGAVVQIVSDVSQATGLNIVYVVLGA